MLIFPLLACFWVSFSDVPIIARAICHCLCILSISIYTCMWEIWMNKTCMPKRTDYFYLAVHCSLITILLLHLTLYECLNNVTNMILCWSGYQVIAGLWFLSIVGNWCNFLTLFYVGKEFYSLCPILVKVFGQRVI